MNARTSTWMLASCVALLHGQNQGLAQATAQAAPSVQNAPQTTENSEGGKPDGVGTQLGKSVEFVNSDLGFSFSYPSELQSESQESLAANWKKATNTSDPKYKASDACTHVLLHSSRKDDSSGPPPSVAIYGEGHSPRVEVTVPVTGSITISEISQQCLPLEFKGREDELLSGFASAVGEEPGMKLIGQPAWYEIEGHKLHAGIAESSGKTNATSAPAASSKGFLVAVAANISGHLVLWMFEAQDLYSINRLIHGSVKFGTGKPQPLLPLDIER